MKTILSLFIIAISMIACSKDEDQAKVDQEIIEKYISDNNLDAEQTASGLYYVIQDTGTGRRPTSTNYVKVAYKGYFTDGDVFDKSSDEGLKFKLTDVIPGWTEGIPLFREGGKGVLLIPSELAYGSQSRTGIPANSVLLFDVHLIRVY